jgi:hypothetical protein
MTTGKNITKDAIIHGFIGGVPIVVAFGTITTGICGVLFIGDMIYCSDMSKSYRDNLVIRDELYIRNRKTDMYHKDLDGMWYVKKE